MLRSARSCARRIAFAVRPYRLVPTARPISNAPAVRAPAQHGRVQLAEVNQLVEDLPAEVSGQGVGLGLRALLPRLAKHKQSDLAWRLFSRLREGGYSFNADSYARFLKAVGGIGKPGLAQRAEAVAAAMRAENAYDPLNAEHVKPLISACANAGKFADAEAAFEEARAAATEAARPLDVSVLRVFVSACARAGRPELARKLYDEHIAAGGQQCLQMLAAVINATSRTGDVQGAERLYTDALASTAAPTTELLNALLLAYRQAGRVEEGLLRYREAVAAVGVMPDNITLKLLIDLCEKGGRLDEAMAICASVQAQGVELDTLTSNSIIRALVRSGQVERAFVVYSQRSAKVGGRPNLRTLGCLSRGCFQASQASEDAEDKAMWQRRALQIYADGNELVAERAGLACAEVYLGPEWPEPMDEGRQQTAPASPDSRRLPMKAMPAPLPLPRIHSRHAAPADALWSDAVPEERVARPGRGRRAADRDPIGNARPRGANQRHGRALPGRKPALSTSGVSEWRRMHADEASAFVR